MNKAPAIDSENELSLKTSKPLFEMVNNLVGFADKARISISPVPDEGGFEVEYLGKDSAWETAINCEDETSNNEIAVFSMFSIIIPKELRGLIAELASRINCDNNSSTYVALNMDEGILGIITNIFLKDGTLTFLMMDHMLASNSKVIEDYTSVIMKVLYCGLKPSEAMNNFHDEYVAVKTLH
jgi:hypothetical protein